MNLDEKERNMLLEQVNVFRKLSLSSALKIERIYNLVKEAKVIICRQCEIVEGPDICLKCPHQKWITEAKEFLK